MAKLIPLTQGKFSTVGDEDYEWAMQWSWYAWRNKNNWYAVRSEGGKKIYLHREIMNAPDGVQVDHQDGDGLNNQRYNLRLATNAQNLQNRGPQVNNTSGFKGVSWHRGAGKWEARIRGDGEQIYLGLFPDKTEAAQAYDSAARKHHGKFAYQNFPEETS